VSVSVNTDTDHRHGHKQLIKKTIQAVKKNLPPVSAFNFVILLGLVSLFSDMVYEGARSIIGPYFALLGASGAIVGFVAGFGELAGNVLRIFSGFLLDKTKQYWFMTFIGYGCLFAIPALMFTHSWIVASILIIVERIGKAIRIPARDAMLSYATQKMGRGFGFGIHQLMDQVGGMLGPFLMTIILLEHAHYSLGFALLFAPAVVAIIFLVVGKKHYPHPQSLEIETHEIKPDKIPTVFWIYLIAACLIGAGYADFPLIAFHFEKAGMMSPIWIPIFYMVAMGMSAASALFFGWIYDKKGAVSLMIAIPLAAFFAPLVFLNGFITALIGMMLWGIGMGAQKSLLKAVVGDMIPKKIRGSAFGIFNAGYGIAWFLGSWLMGVLYDTSVRDLIIFSVSAELLALPVVWWVWKRGAK